MTKPTVKIENFDIETELQCRCGCGRFSYSQEYLIRLQAFRYKYGKGLTVTGGGRCKKHNKEVGGVANSLHICEGKEASATDVTGKSPLEIYNEACLSGLFNEVIYYRTKGFVHLGYDPSQKGNYFCIK